MPDFFRDLLYALRTLRRSRGFLITALLTLALGIGANTAIFTVIRAVLLKPLDYPEPDRVLLLSGGATIAHFDEMRASIQSFPEIGDYRGGIEDLTISGAGDPEVLKAVRVSANFLRILQVEPALGRGFRDEEDASGGPRVAMISYSLWQRRFGGNPGIAGQSVTLSSVPFTVVGVLPPTFQFPQGGVDVWITRPAEFVNSSSPLLSIFARLKPGVSVEQAGAELTIISRRYAAAHPEMLDAKTKGGAEHPLPLKEHLVENVREMLWMLFGAVSFVLLIACANVSSLLLARAASRSREFAVRAALGAGKGRLIRQLLTESVLLAAGGGVLGLALAQASLRAMTAMSALNLPRLDQVRLDGSVVAFTIAASFVSALLFGLAPSFGASRPDLADVLRAHGQTTSAARSWFSPRKLLIVVQVALSMVLLVGAGLLMQSLNRVYRVDLGFNTSHLLTMRVALSFRRYDTDQKKTAFFDTLVRRVEALPGVQSAGVTWTTPLMIFPKTPVQRADQPALLLNKRPLAMVQNVTPDYFRTMQVPLKGGRGFSDRDDAGAPMVVLVNESLARQLWPGADPVGQRMLIGVRTDPIEVVGVVADMHQAPEIDPVPSIFRPFAQVPQPSDVFVVRTTGDPMRQLRAITAEIRSIDPDQAVSDVQTMEAREVSSEGDRRVVLVLLAGFSLTALVLSMVGIYGLIAYNVTQRTQELGIRRALGAQHADILRLVIGHGLFSVIAGIAVGLGGAAALTRVMKSILFRISATDPWTFGGVAVLFLLIALVASYVPARRAAQVDPASALRL